MSGMWDNAVTVSVPLYVGIVLVLGGLYMTYNPDLHRMRLGRKIVLAALAMTAIVPIYIIISNGSPFPGRLAYEGIAGALLALVMYGFYEWTEVQIKELAKKSKIDS